MSKNNKFRLLAFVIVVAIVAAMILPSCSTFIRLNEDREANTTLISVTNNGITITVSQNEINDYFYTMYSQYYQYIQQGYYGIDQILESAIESKMKTAYLLTNAMPFLVNAETTSKERFNALSGGGNYLLPADVLTHAERSLAVYSVNMNMDESLKHLRETAYFDSFNNAAKKISKENVEGIYFAEETLAYLQEVYYLDAELDRARIKIYVKYDDGTDSETFVVTNAMFKTQFSSDFEDDNTAKTPEDKKIEIVFEELVTKKEETTIEEHHLTHNYTLKAPRATKKDVEEKEDLKKIEINEIKVDRYATIEELKEKDVYYEERDFQQEYEDLKKTIGADKFMVKAYEDMLNNLKRAYKDIQYYYTSSYQTMVMAALQAELSIDVMRTLTVAEIEKEMLREFDYLYSTTKATYGEASEKDGNKTTFTEKVTDGISTLYYYPAIEDLTGTFYVYNLLFNFSDEQSSFLADITGDILIDYQEYVKDSVMTKAANPQYDSEFECPLHKNHEEGGVCSHDGEGVCPAVPFGKVVEVDGEPQLIIDYEEKAIDVMARLEAELKEIYDDAEKTPEEISQLALSKFEDYMYTYNEDPGIMNNSIGYYGLNEGFQKAFIDLAKDVFSYSGLVGNAFVWTDKNENKIQDADEIGLGYAFSSYGIHLIAISFVPFANDTDDQELAFASDDEKIAYLKRTYDNLGNTYYDDFKATIEKAKKNARYSDYTAEYTPEKMYELDRDTNKIKMEKELKNIVTINQKKIKEIFDKYLG